LGALAQLDLDGFDGVATEHDELLALDLYFLPRVGTKVDNVPDIEVEGDELAVVEGLARARRYDLPVMGLLLGILGDDDAALRDAVGFGAADEYLVM
jgi:hypothetical protein